MDIKSNEPKLIGFDLANCKDQSVVAIMDRQSKIMKLITDNMTIANAVCIGRNEKHLTATAIKERIKESDSTMHNISQSFQDATLYGLGIISVTLPGADTKPNIKRISPVSIYRAPKWDKIKYWTHKWVKTKSKQPRWVRLRSAA